MVAKPYSSSPECEVHSDNVSHRCGVHLVWWAVKILARQWLGNTELDLVLLNSDPSQDAVDDDGSAHLNGSGRYN